MTGPTRAGLPAGELRFAVTVTAGYALLVGIGLVFHEMWRDELQAWTIATASDSLSSLYVNSRFEGHTALWFVLLLAASRVSRAPEMMQLVHGLVATASIFLITWRAPFPRLWRALLPFGYFLAYEYAIVSRPYALGVLLLVAWCAVRVERPTAWLLPATLLAVLANTSAFGALLAIAAFASMLAAITRDGWEQVRAHHRVIVLATCIVGAGGAIAFAWMTPPRRHVEAVVALNPESNDERVVHAALTPLQALAPLPAIQSYPRLWSKNLLLERGGPKRLMVASVLSLGALFLIIGSFRSVEGIVLAGTFSLAYLAFDLKVYAGHVYHHGHLALAILAALWLSSGKTRVPRATVTALLMVHVAAGAMMMAADLTSTFSGARAAADIVARESAANEPLVAAPAHIGTGVAAFLDRSIYFPDRSYTGSFARWNATVAYRECTAGEQALIGARERLWDHPSVVVILSRPAPRTEADIVLSVLGSVSGTIAGEDFWVYRATRAHDAPRVDPGDLSLPSCHRRGPPPSP